MTKIRTVQIDPERMEEFRYSRAWKKIKRQNMDESEPAVQLIASYLRNIRGCKVVVSEHVLDDEGLPMMGVQDDGDIWCTYPGSKRTHLYEVKWQKYYYDPNEWPHYDFIVDQYWTYETKEHKPNWYVYVNKNMTWVGWLNCKASKDLWFVRPGKCPTDLVIKKFYVMCIKHMQEQVIWMPIPEELRKKFYPGDNVVRRMIAKRKRGQEIWKRRDRAT